jgi:hypothetical protein
MPVGMGEVWTIPPPPPVDAPFKCFFRDLNEKSDRNLQSTTTTTCVLRTPCLAQSFSSSALLLWLSPPPIPTVAYLYLPTGTVLVGYGMGVAKRNNSDMISFFVLTDHDVVRAFCVDWPASCSPAVRTEYHTGTNQ